MNSTKVFKELVSDLRCVCLVYPMSSTEGSIRLATRLG